MTNICVILHYDTAILRSSEAVSWWVCCQLRPSLILVFSVEHVCQWLKTSPNSSLAWDHVYQMTFKVSHSVLKTHYVHLFIFFRIENQLHKIIVVLRLLVSLLGLKWNSRELQVFIKLCINGCLKLNISEILSWVAFSLRSFNFWQNFDLILFFYQKRTSLSFRIVPSCRISLQIAIINYL